MNQFRLVYFVCSRIFYQYLLHNKTLHYVFSNPEIPHFFHSYTESRFFFPKINIKKKFRKS